MPSPGPLPSLQQSLPQLVVQTHIHPPIPLAPAGAAPVLAAVPPIPPLVLGRSKLLKDDEIADTVG